MDQREELEQADEPTESEWLRLAASSAAYDDLHDPAEDIYTLEDGKPFVDEATRRRRADRP